MKIEHLEYGIKLTPEPVFDTQFVACASNDMYISQIPKKVNGRLEFVLSCVLNCQDGE
jgi:hypothetical protein